VTVTLSAGDTGGSGVDKTYYTTTARRPQPRAPSTTPQQPVLSSDGQKITYFSTDNAGNAEIPALCYGAHPDRQHGSDDHDSVDANWHASPVSATLTATDNAGGSGVKTTSVQALHRRGGSGEDRSRLEHITPRPSPH